MTDEAQKLQGTVESLQAELNGLREALAESERQRGFSRRQLLAGGAGVVGAVAGAGMLAGNRSALAAEPQAMARVTADATPANSARMLIKGQKQGTFKGEGTSQKDGYWIPFIDFEYSIVSPRDAASGLPTGKRQHKPITIVKQWGAASPQLFEALVTNETLTQVKFEFYRTNPLGAISLFQTISLVNASVATFEQFIGDVLGNRTNSDQRQLDLISFTYQKITIENTVSKTSASDDWSAPIG